MRARSAKRSFKSTGDVWRRGRFVAIQDSRLAAQDLPPMNLTAHGAGWLFHNYNYFARPDNTGTALFR